jgi:hypothetical protein
MRIEYVRYRTVMELKGFRLVRIKIDEDMLNT